MHWLRVIKILLIEYSIYAIPLAFAFFLTIWCEDWITAKFVIYCLAKVLLMNWKVLMLEAGKVLARIVIRVDNFIKMILKCEVLTSGSYDISWAHNCFTSISCNFIIQRSFIFSRIFPGLFSFVSFWPSIF